MPKEIDDFSVCGETWYGIYEVQGILKQLDETRLWLEAGGNYDHDMELAIASAHNNAHDLKRHLIDLQIKLLTIL